MKENKTDDNYGDMLTLFDKYKNYRINLKEIDLKEYTNQELNHLYYGSNKIISNFSLAYSVALQNLIYGGIDMGDTRHFYGDNIDQDKNPRQYNINISSIVLTLIYANGFGVEKNLDTSIYFALLGAITYVDALKNYASENSSEIFDLCGEQTTWDMVYCSNKLTALKHNVTYLKWLNNLKYSDKELALFYNLKDIAHDYFATKSWNEMGDRSGSIRGILLPQEIDAQIIRFTSTMEDLENKKIIAVSKEEFYVADKELNRIYKQVLEELSGVDDDDITSKKDVVETERAWIKYKAAFVKFAQERYKNYNKETIEYLLTTHRISDLKNVLNPPFSG
jgi:uncharacterized protein YecT (DUF1311 family)